MDPQTQEEPKPSGKTSPPRQDDKLTVRECAEMWSVEYDTALAWINKGAVPHMRVGPSRWIRVFRKDAEAMIEFRN